MTIKRLYTEPTVLTIMENGSRSKINDLLVYLAICIALVVFILASFPSFGIQITQSQILLKTLGAIEWLAVNVDFCSAKRT